MPDFIPLDSEHGSTQDNSSGDEDELGKGDATFIMSDGTSNLLPFDCKHDFKYHDLGNNSLLTADTGADQEPLGEDDAGPSTPLASRPSRSGIKRQAIDQDPSIPVSSIHQACLGTDGCW